MRYDILLVGAGITSATIAALCKDKYNICIIDVRSHTGGNCYDYADNGSHIHKYGPHIFHSPNHSIVEFLSNYTEWTNYEYIVAAMINIDNKILNVPFPYSEQTELVINKKLSDSEIIDYFFRGYSEKMWGRQWENLPNYIKNRVPKRTKTSNYFPDQFVAMPSKGYSAMIDKMQDGCHVILNVDKDDWLDIDAKCVVFCGRPDLIKLKDGSRISDKMILDYRTLDIIFEHKEWIYNSHAINCCISEIPFTRMVSYKMMTGGTSNIISTEYPKTASANDINPYYPVQSDSYNMIVNIIKENYPNMVLAGRMGTHKYLDMYMAVANAMTIAKKFS